MRSGGSAERRLSRSGVPTIRKALSRVARGLEARNERKIVSALVLRARP
jgi:hypothetical protein